MGKKSVFGGEVVSFLQAVEVQGFKQIATHIWVCVVLALILGAPFISTVQAKVAVETSIISAVKKYVETGTADYDVSLRIPVASGMVDEQLQAKVNAIFDSKARQFAEDIINESVAFVRDAEEYGFPIRTFAAYTDYEVTLNTKEFLSLYITYYSFTGGAHGMTFVEVYNINLRTGEFIELRDMFSGNVDYKSPVNKEIQRLMSEEPERYFSDCLLTAAISEEQSYYLTNEGIVVHFGLYELAPYSSGMSEFLITYDKIKTLIDKEYSFLWGE